jgi:hypothetical protein
MVVEGSRKEDGGVWMKLAIPINIRGVASFIPRESVSKIPVKILGKE